MGMSEPFESKKDAFAWLTGTIGEDINQAAYDRKFFDCDFGAGDDVFKTVNERQTVFYGIVEEAS